MTHQRLLVVVGVLAAAALVGLVVLWPRGEPELAPVSAAQTTQLVEATLLEVVELPALPDDVALLPGSTDVEVTARLDATGETVTFVTTDETGSTYRAGQRVKLAAIEQPGQPTTYFVSDFRRGGALTALVALFLVAVIGFGRWHGVRALLGLALTFAIIIGFVVPAILAGRPPIVVALVGAVLVLLVTLYLSHGVSPKTTAAVVGTSLALAVTAALSVVFVRAASITGFASEEAIQANYSVGGLSLRGLLLAGIILGGLGVLDDVTMSQSSLVGELHAANPQLGFAGLWRSALVVGRDHIAATVNTLFLAYAGAALPLLLLFSVSADPIGTVVTSEVVAVELVRTLVGSIGLVAAVPLTTALAALLAEDAAPAPLSAQTAPPVPPPPAPGPSAPTVSAEAVPEDHDPEWEAELRASYGLPERPPPAAERPPPAAERLPPAAERPPPATERLPPVPE